MRIFLLLALAALITASSALAAGASSSQRSRPQWRRCYRTARTCRSTSVPTRIRRRDGVYVCDAGTKGDEFLEFLTPINSTKSGGSRRRCAGAAPKTLAAVPIPTTQSILTLPTWTGRISGVSYSFPSARDWNRGKVTVYPDKPIESLVCYCLFRNHSGKAYFKDFELRQYKFNQITFFDGVPIELNKLDQKEPENLSSRRRPKRRLLPHRQHRPNRRTD